MPLDLPASASADPDSPLPALSASPPPRVPASSSSDLSASPPPGVPASQPPSSAAASPEPLLTVIEPRPGWRAIDFPELWRYRELLGFLVWRDIKVRYKQTVLGVAWAVLQPLLTMVVFTIFFGRLGGMARHTASAAHYPVFVFAALLPWTFFAHALSQSGQSLVSSANLVKKIYFPRLFIPLAPIGAGLVDFAFSSLVMAGLMLAYGVSFTPSLLLAPLFLAGTLLTAVGVGTLLSALVVAYRDFRYVIPFLVQIWMFASPVAYPLSMVPSRWRLLYAANPMVGMIEGFRSALLGQPVPWPAVAVSLLSALLLLAAGLLYFRRTERRFADII